MDKDRVLSKLRNKRDLARGVEPLLAIDRREPSMIPIGSQVLSGQNIRPFGAALGGASENCRYLRDPSLRERWRETKAPRLGCAFVQVHSTHGTKPPSDFLQGVSRA